MVEKIIEIETPCCSSIRSCNQKVLYIIGFRNPRNPKVLKRIEAIRCYKEGEKKYRIILTNDILVVYAKSTLTYIVLYKPDGVDEETARTLVIRALFDNPDEVLVSKISVSFQPLLT
jgi:hypothetical protein